MKLALIVPSAAALALVMGCSTTTPRELLDARSAYDQAAQGPASQVAPADLNAAKETLASAEQAFHDHGDSEETKDVAYAAERKAELATVNARTVLAAQERVRAQARAEAAEQQRAEQQAAQLAAANQQLAVQGQQLMTETQQREEAEKRAQQVSAALARVASVQQEPRGMVITLSGPVLFASGKSDLLPDAQRRLTEVANALAKEDPSTKILVDGYTDSQGGAGLNDELSKSRAQSVRAFFVSQGLAADRIVAQGFGPANPVAENATAEGRADNRRVEIVVQPATRSNGVGMASKQAPSPGLANTSPPR